MLAVLLVAGSIAIEMHHGYPLTSDRLLRPRPAPEVLVTQHSENGLTYAVPESGVACWRAPLPCAKQELQGVRLLAPERGLAGGFFESQ
jgi:hypothetical protein